MCKVSVYDKIVIENLKKMEIKDIVE